MSLIPESFDTWTAGAQRVWAAACASARSQADAAVSVEHLLWGLITIESRAAELLQRAGVSPDAFQAHWQPQRQLDPPPDLPGPTTECGSSPAELPRHELLDVVIIEARHSAFQEHAELGTEHLLHALCRIPSEAATWLRQFGQFGMSALPPATTNQSAAANDGSQARRDDSEIVTSAELQVPWRDPRPIDRSETFRILDAAANRAREGFRVVEDFVRWAWNDGFLSRQLKERRHELADILSHLPAGTLVAARDTEHDVGTEIRTESEYRRESPAAVAAASLKRIEEALRSLEEFSKTVDADLSPRFEQLRYRMYTLEKAIAATNQARRRLAGQHICLLATTSLCHHGLGPAIHGALEAGVKLIQLREKSLPDRELLELARHVRQWTRETDGLFIVNDRPDVAALVEADGVHLGQDDFDVASARRILGPDKLIGVSTHSIEQARQAVLDGADYLGVGPVYPSSTKSFSEFPGLAFVRQVAAEISLPWFAIGGITAGNLPQLLEAGATRIAVSGAICSAEEPGWAAAELMQRLQAGG